MSEWSEIKLVASLKQTLTKTDQLDSNCSYICIRVEIDISKPLKVGFPLPREDLSTIAWDTPRTTAPNTLPINTPKHYSKLASKLTIPVFAD